MVSKFKRSNPAVGGQSVPVDEEGVLNPAFGISSDFPRLVELDVDSIQPNPAQPRQFFDEDGLRELADSIVRQGLLQPIVVKRTADGYMLAAGERRWRAHRLLGRSTIFAIVTTGDADEIALVENLQRRNLDALETASGLSRLGSRHGYTQEQIAAAVGLSKSEVSRLLALMTLPDLIRKDYANVRETVGKSHLFLLADCANEAEQLALWARIRQGATIRDLRIARQSGPAASTSEGAATRSSGSGDRIGEIQRLSQRLDRLAGQPFSATERLGLEGLRRQIEEMLQS